MSEVHLIKKLLEGKHWQINFLSLWNYASLKLPPLITEYNKWETLYIYEPFDIFSLFSGGLLEKKTQHATFQQTELNRHYQNIYIRRC